MGLEQVPMILFPKGAWHALDSVIDIGYNVVGLDWLHDSSEAVKIRGSRNVAFQGNADPGVLYGSKEAITEAVQNMVDGFWTGSGGKGWIANLGHGTYHLAFLGDGCSKDLSPRDMKLTLNCRYYARC